MRIWPLALATVVSFALLAACGVEEDEERDSAASVVATAAAAASPIETSAPTAPVSPSPEPGEAERITCVFPADIMRFRLNLSTETTRVSPSEVWGESGRKPYSGSWDAFEGLSEDSALEYSYVLPDRVSVRIFENHEELGSRVSVGPNSWYRMVGSTEWIKESPPHDMSLSTQEFCECINEKLKTDLLSLEGEKETVNGVATRHYQISKSSSMDGQTSPDGLSPECPWESTYDVWLAEEGNWPVRTVYKVTCGAGLLEQSTTIESWEITGVNDPSIVIETPTTS
jgi:hypothetical protein